MILFWRHHKAIAPTPPANTPRTTADPEVRAWAESTVLRPAVLAKLEDELTAYQVNPHLTEEEALIASVAVKDARGNGTSVHLASTAALVVAAGSLFTSIAYTEPSDLTRLVVLAALIVGVGVVIALGAHAVHSASRSAGTRAIIEHRRDRDTLRRASARLTEAGE